MSSRSAVLSPTPQNCRRTRVAQPTKGGQTPASAHRTLIQPILPRRPSGTVNLGQAIRPPVGSTCFPPAIRMQTTSSHPQTTSGHLRPPADDLSRGVPPCVGFPPVCGLPLCGVPSCVGPSPVGVSPWVGSPPGWGVPSPRWGVSRPGWGVSRPGWGVSRPGWGVSSPGWGVSSPGWGVSSPGWGVSSPGWGVSPPGWGVSLFAAGHPWTMLERRQSLPFWCETVHRRLWPGAARRGPARRGLAWPDMARRCLTCPCSNTWHIDFGQPG